MAAANPPKPLPITTAWGLRESEVEVEDALVICTQYNFDQRFDNKPFTPQTQK